jgi:DNA modification methylase
MPEIKVLEGDCRQVLKTLEANSVNTIITSPPYYGQRDYDESDAGSEPQIGQEETVAEFLSKLVEIFRECKRVLRYDGTLWININDSYAGSGKGRNKNGKASPAVEGRKQATNVGSIAGKVRKVKYDRSPKNLLGIPWRLAFALQDDGWILRQDNIWYKPNPMIESVKDRTTRSHEYVFFFSKSRYYYYDYEAILEEYASKPENGVKKLRDKHGEGYTADYAVGVRFSPGARDYYNGEGRNKHSVWIVPTATGVRFDDYGLDFSASSLNQQYVDYGDSETSQTQEPLQSGEPTQFNSNGHHAVFPEKLIEPCVLAGAPLNGYVLDPFAGSGTTGRVAVRHGRNAILIEQSSKYVQLIRERVDKIQMILPL